MVTAQPDSTFDGVEGYIFRVSPEPDSMCSSYSAILGNGSYTCAGLEVGKRYSYSVSAINCGDQEGEGVNFLVYPQGKLDTYVGLFFSFLPIC